MRGAGLQENSDSQRLSHMDFDKTTTKISLRIVDSSVELSLPDALYGWTRARVDAAAAV